MNPRYILFIHLVVNDMIQLTTSISLFVLSYVFYRISTSLCCFIVTFVVFTSVNSPLNLALMAVECYIAVCFPLRHAELCTIKRTYFLIGCIWGLILSYILFTLNVSFCIVMLILAVSTGLNNPLTLAAMALECYLAICFPLRHPQICTVRKTYIVITMIWVLSLLTILPDLFIIIATRPAEYFHSSAFCLWANVFTDPNLAKKKDVTNILFLVIVWLILFYAYFKILFAAQAASVNAKKARNTVLLHGFQLLLCMLSYIHSISIQGLSILFPKDTLAIRYVISLLIQVMPRLISPMVYGIRDKMFRQYLIRYWLPLNSNVYPENVQKS
uniref:G-protein coupled receptors family 1 profile domain-containing protein n=1 Tax=Poecilia latipinna TaxID=48699 RepID=A0A3B3V3U1_9TELE